MSCRFDKYVWSVRLAKTRSLAAQEISKGRIRLNGESTKPAKEVKLGDEINVSRHTAIFTYRIIQLLDRRVGAKLVPDYLIDITPEDEIEKLRLYQLNQKSYRRDGSGKPSKRDRLDLDAFIDDL